MDQLLNFIGWDPLLQTKNRFTYIINSFSIGLVLLFFIFYITVIRKPVIILFTLLCLTSTICSITVVFYFYAHNLSTTNKELKLLANTDVLTKISNRRTLIREGESLFDFSVKYKKNSGSSFLI